MASQKKPRRRVRFVFQRSSIVTKIIVLITLVITTAALLTLTISIRNNRKQAEADRQRAAELEHINASLAQGIQDAGSIKGDKAYAENELGYVDGNAVIIDPAPTESAATQEQTDGLSVGTVLIIVGASAAAAAAVALYIVTRKKSNTPVSNDKTDITPRS